MASIMGDGYHKIGDKSATASSCLMRTMPIAATNSAHLIKAAGYHKSTAQTGAVTLIQRFWSALNLNIHFHILFLDGVYVSKRSITPVLFK